MAQVERVAGLVADDLGHVPAVSQYSLGGAAMGAFGSLPAAAASATQPSSSERARGGEPIQRARAAATPLPRPRGRTWASRPWPSSPSRSLSDYQRRRSPGLRTRTCPCTRRRHTSGSRGRTNPCSCRRSRCARRGAGAAAAARRWSRRCCNCRVEVMLVVCWSLGAAA